MSRESLNTRSTPAGSDLRLTSEHLSAGLGFDVSPQGFHAELKPRCPLERRETVLTPLCDFCKVLREDSVFLWHSPVIPSTVSAFKVGLFVSGP